MNILRRAFSYITRKWQQTLIVFFVLLVVSTSVLVGLSILKASDVAAANLRRQLGGSFSLEIDMSNPDNMQSAASSDRYSGSYYKGDVIDGTVIDEVLKTPGIADYSANTVTVANLKSLNGQYYELAENRQNTYSSYGPHIASIQAWTSLRQCSYFANGLLEITQGEMFSGEKSHQAVISRELAELNHLAVGDKIVLEINQEVIGFDVPTGKQNCTFEIAGIFDFVGEQKIDQYTSRRQMLQNWVFVDSQTLLPFLNEVLGSVHIQPIGYEKVMFRVNDPAEMDSILTSIRQNSAINWDCFKTEVDNTSYQKAENALQSMDGSIRVMVWIIAIAGIAVFILLLTIWAKFRIHETGVLLALGRSKGSILAQRMIEIAMIAVLAFGLSFFTSNAAANGLGNALLARANEQSTVTEEKTPLQPGMPFTSDNIDLSPVFEDAEVEELTVVVYSDIFIIVCLGGLLLAALAVSISSVPVMKAKPKMILSKMS